MDCYVVTVPAGGRLTGFTIDGRKVPILPGDYHVHRMAPRAAAGTRSALRFVGAHGPDNDVHIALPDGTDIGEALAVRVKAIAQR